MRETSVRRESPSNSQPLQNLRDRWGAPRERVVQPGASSETGTDSLRLRSTPPDPRWAQAMRQQRRQERRRR